MVVKTIVNEGDECVLCTLDRSCPSYNCDLVFPPGTSIGFIAEGNGTVSLTGYFEAAVEDFDDEDEDDEDDEDEEEDEDEEGEEEEEEEEEGEESPKKKQRKH